MFSFSKIIPSVFLRFYLFDALPSPLRRCALFLNIVAATLCKGGGVDKDQGKRNTMSSTVLL